MRIDTDRVFHTMGELHVLRAQLDAFADVWSRQNTPSIVQVEGYTIVVPYEWNMYERDMRKSSEQLGAVIAMLQQIAVGQLTSEYADTEKVSALRSEWIEAKREELQVMRDEMQESTKGEELQS